MKYALANSLSTAVSGLDPDAKAYIDAVVAAGATVTSTQKNAINTFVKDGKSDGWYAKINRLYFTIWASASPNSICLKTQIAGTFVGGVTHSSGFVQGNGTTGYFNFGVSPATLGITNTSGMLGGLLYVADSRNDSRSFIGARDAGASGECHAYQLSGSQAYGIIGRLPSTPLATITTTPNGIIVANRTTTGLQLHRLFSSGVQSSANQTTTATNAITTKNIFSMALNADGTPIAFSNAKLGSYFAGVGLSQSEAIAFSANLKTLWETCTGLTLP